MKKSVKQRLAVLALAMMMALSLAGCGTSSKGFYEAASDSAVSEAPEAEFMVTEEAKEEMGVEDAVEQDAGGISDTSAAAGENGAAQAQTSEKIIYTYNYSVETKQFDELMSLLQKRITEYGGYVESSETNGNQEMNIRRYAYMVIRIPADKMHSFLDMVKQNSNVTHSGSSSENVTLSYVDMQSHIKALKTEQETLMTLLEKAEKLEDIITIQSQLTSIRYELESYESQLRVFDNRINYSTLYLDINEVERETNVATELSYGEEIRRGLSDTFYRIGRGMREFSIWFIVNLPVLLIAVVLVVIFFVVRGIRKRMAGKRPDRTEHRRRKHKGGTWTAAPKAEETPSETKK